MAGVTRQVPGLLSQESFPHHIPLQTLTSAKDRWFPTGFLTLCALGGSGSAMVNRETRGCRQKFRLGWRGYTEMPSIPQEQTHSLSCLGRGESPWTHPPSDGRRCRLAVSFCLLDGTEKTLQASGSLQPGRTRFLALYSPLWKVLFLFQLAWFIVFFNALKCFSSWNKPIFGFLIICLFSSSETQ